MAKQAATAKKGKTKPPKATGPSVATYPPAAASVRRVRARVALAGFVLAVWLAHGAGVSTSGMLERGLVSGVAGGLLGWACALAVWRHLLLAELRRLGEGGGAPRPAAALVGSGDAPAADPAGAEAR